jgi:hypothetical protein
VLAVEDPDNVVDPVVMAERRARRAELAEEELRELLREAELGAATLKGRLAAVEGELATARAQRNGLAADLARREEELQAAARREAADQALRTEAQTRAAEAQTGSQRELDDLRVRLVAAEQRAALLTQLEAEVGERLEHARAAEVELDAMRSELEARQAEVVALRAELERQAPAHAEPVLDPQLAARMAAERNSFAAQIAAIEHTVAGLRPRLTIAIDALVERLEESERSLAAERQRVAELEEELARPSGRHEAVVAVVAELSAAVDELRERFAADLDDRVAALSGAADELRSELGTEQRLHSAAQAELERLRAERAEALAELARERERRTGAELAHAEAEAVHERTRAAHAEAQAAHEEARAAHAEAQAALARHIAERDDLAQAQAAHDETHAEVRAELEAARAEVEVAREEMDRRSAELEQRRIELEQRQAEHIALQAELAREQAQHAAAQVELGNEQERRATVEAELALERERRQATEAELEALRSAPPEPPAAPTLDPEDLARAAARLRAQAPPPEAEAEAAVEEPQVEPEPTGPPPDRRSELADVLAAQQEAAAAAAAPDPYAHLPAFPVRAVVPFAAGEGEWLREGIRNVGRSDAALAAELLLALTPVQAHAVRRPVAYQLTVGDAGTWRVSLKDMEAAIEAGASEAKVAFRVSGSAGDLAALFAGGGRRKLAAHTGGSRLALWRVARARREAPTLAQAFAAGGDFSLRAILALLGSVAPEGGRTVVAFDDGDSPVTAVATRRGAVVLRSGIEQPQATVHGPERDLIALLVGLAPSNPVRVSGDITQASAFVTRLHRAQGLV